MTIKNKNFRTNKYGRMDLCSGLMDSNGELIYEHDLLKSIVWKSEHFYVEFRQGKFYGDAIISK